MLLLLLLLNSHLSAWAHQLLSGLWSAVWPLVGRQLSWPSHTAARNTHSIVTTTQTGWRNLGVATRACGGDDQLPQSHRHVQGMTGDLQGMSVFRSKHECCLWNSLTARDHTLLVGAKHNCALQRTTRIVVVAQDVVCAQATSHSTSSRTGAAPPVAVGHRVRPVGVHMLSFPSLIRID